ncbi:hypothetical protein PoB_002669200 [Plakobranchus ocellatus]|uniref:Uncharacterized protein n=1 Tax=Plakobranchus ocellatus TaxID=259542 RepID=A0AAV3ZYR3_9GAST|nr:hypothetical protein PoB_002669200 [Plakobranchus ocellatus]
MMRMMTAMMMTPPPKMSVGAEDELWLQLRNKMPARRVRYQPALCQRSHYCIGRVGFHPVYSSVVNANLYQTRLSV